MTALSAVAVFAIPGIAEAQTVTISSMARATCVGAGNCSQLRFYMDLTGVMNSPQVRLYSNDAGLWTFAGLIGVSNGNGNALPWFGTGGGTDLTVENSGFWTPGSVYVTTQMRKYPGFGNPDHGAPGFDVHDVPRGPTVENPIVTEDTPDIPVAAPEPGTMLLLGTGLTGIAGAARRRRRAQAS